MVSAATTLRGMALVSNQAAVLKTRLMGTADSGLDSDCSPNVPALHVGQNATTSSTSSSASSSSSSATLLFSAALLLLLALLKCFTRSLPSSPLTSESPSSSAIEMCSVSSATIAHTPWPVAEVDLENPAEFGRDRIVGDVGGLKTGGGRGCHLFLSEKSSAPRRASSASVGSDAVRESVGAEDGLCF